MKLAIIHDYLNQYGGAERLLECLHRMFPAAPVYTILHDPARLPDDFSNWDIRPSWINRLPGIRRHYEKMIPLFPMAVEDFDLAEYDAVVSLSSAWVKGVITKPASLHVCICTSPMRFAWDEYHQRTGRLRNPAMRWLLRRALHRIRIWDVISSSRPDAYIAISDEVKKRIGKYYRREAEVIRPGIDCSLFKPDGGAPGGFYLTASRLKPYKRIDLAVEAFSRMGKELVVIGDGPLRGELESKAGPSISFLGKVTDRELLKHYQRCRAFIFPANEDYGLTPLEAQACGRPVIAFGLGGALETVKGGETGLFFADQSVQSLAETVNQFEKMKFDSGRIRRHAEGFDQSLFAAKLGKAIGRLYLAHKRLSR